jgi:hypothetical protein
MKAAITFLGIITTLLTASQAQEHLAPEPGLLAEYDEYFFKVREVFAAAQADDVICRVVILESFVPELLVGVRKTGHGHDIFRITPSSAIWDTELVRMYESGQFTSFNKDGKKLTLEENESYQTLKKNTPADFRKITTAVKAVAVDEALARRIAAIWERMLLAARHPKEPRQGLDGASYHFSMSVSGRGVITGQVWSPDEKTKTGALVELAYALSEFATGHSDIEALKKTVSRVEKLTKD